MRGFPCPVVVAGAAALALGLAVGCAPPPPQVQTLFSAPPWKPEEFALVGDAAFGGRKAHLAQVAGVWQRGLISFKSPVPVGRDFELNARFTHATVPGSPLLGMSLVFHRDPRGTAAIGGYGDNYGFTFSDARHAGIAPGAGFLFNFHSNLVKFVSTDSPQGPPTILATAPAPIAAGAEQVLKIRYDSRKGVLAAWINRSPEPVVQAGIFLPLILGGSEAWVAFCGTATKGGMPDRPEGEGAFVTEFIFNSIVPR